MKKIVIIGLSLILGLGLMVVPVMAQGAGFGRRFGMGPGYGPAGNFFATLTPGSLLPQTQLKGLCRIDPSITFSEEQTKELENLQRAFLEEAKPLWSELRDLRLELRFAVSDPQIQSQILLDKQRRMSSIQARLENLRFSYLIKTRSIFTKE